MFQTLKLFLEQNISWLEILLSLIVNLIFIITLILTTIRRIKRKLRFRVQKDNAGLCALSIGMGKNDPYQAVVRYMGENNKDKIISYHKFHKGKKDKDLTQAEIITALDEIETIVGSLRRKNIKEVMIFCATPVAVAIKIGYLFRNYPGMVKLMHWNKEKNDYELLLTI